MLLLTLLYFPFTSLYFTLLQKSKKKKGLKRQHTAMGLRGSSGSGVAGLAGGQGLGGKGLEDVAGLVALVGSCPHEVVILEMKVDCIKVV